MALDDNLIEEILRALTRVHRPRKPEDYHRVAEITDDKALMLQTAMLLKKKEASEAQRLVETLMSELDGMKGRLFMRLHEVYPSVTATTGPEYGRVIKHKGKLYYVGLDLEEQSAEE